MLGLRRLVTATAGDSPRTRDGSASHEHTDNPDEETSLLTLGSVQADVLLECYEQVHSIATIDTDQQPPIRLI